MEQPGQSKIMTQPLPKILDEIEAWIRRVEEATKKAEQATVEALKAAGEARIAGEKAAGEAAKVAQESIATTEDRLQKQWALALDDVLKLAQEALAAAKTAIDFAKLVNKAQVNSMNALVKAYNDTIGAQS